MASTVYDTRVWRELPRDGSCVLAPLFPDDCEGRTHYHHVVPVSRGGDPEGPVVALCQRHHPMVEALTRRVTRWRTCPHGPSAHRYPGAREACERRMNRAAL